MLNELQLMYDGQTILFLNLLLWADFICLLGSQCDEPFRPQVEVVSILSNRNWALTVLKVIDV